MDCLQAPILVKQPEEFTAKYWLDCFTSFFALGRKENADGTSAGSPSGEVAVTKWNQLVDQARRIGVDQNCYLLQLDSAQNLRFSFANAIMSGIDLQGFKIKGLYALECDFTNARFDNAELEGCIFRECCLDYTAFVMASLEHCDFYVIKSFRTNFGGAKLKNCHVEGSVWIKPELRQVKILDTRFEYSKIMDTTFEGAIIVENELLECSLIQTLLSGAELINNKFLVTIFEDVDFDYRPSCISAGQSPAGPLRGVPLSFSNDFRRCCFIRGCMNWQLIQKCNFQDSKFEAVTHEKPRLCLVNENIFDSLPSELSGPFKPISDRPHQSKLVGVDELKF